MSATVRYLPGAGQGTPAPAPAPARARLTAWQRMEVEEARGYLASAPFAAELADPGAAYLAGRLDATARILLSIIDAVTEVA